MTSLHQIVAIEKGVKTVSQREFTDAYKRIQNKVPLSGLTRTYQPVDDENGDTLPSESTLVQSKVTEIVETVTTALARMFDVVATKDTANCSAKADIVVDGIILAKGVPSTNLLFLEKQLIDLRTFVAALPTLDPAFNWTWDGNNGVYETDPVQTIRTKKVLRNHVKYEATDKHPAQVDTFGEDMKVGTWTKVEQSGAIPAMKRKALLERVDSVCEAVRSAREKANEVTVTDVALGKSILDYVFAPLRTA